MTHHSETQCILQGQTVSYMTIISGNLALIHYYHLRLRPNSPIVTKMSFIAKGSSSESCVTLSCQVFLVFFSLQEFPRLSLTFVTRPVFCRILLNVGLSVVSSWLGSGYAINHAVFSVDPWHVICPLINLRYSSRSLD